MRQFNRLLINALSSYGVTSVRGLVSLLLVPYLLISIGKESYGSVLFVLTFLGFVEVISNGLSKALVKYISGALEKNQKLIIDRIYSSSFILFLIVGSVGSMMILIAAINVEQLIPFTTEKITFEVKRGIVIVGAILPLYVFGGVWKGVLGGKQRYDLINLIGGLHSIGRASLIVIYYSFIGSDLFATIFIFIFSALVERLALGIVAHKLDPDLRFRKDCIKIEQIKLITRFCGYSFLVSLSNGAITHLMKALIGIKLGLEILASYGVALTLTTLVNTMIRSLANIVLPVASKYGARKDIETLKLLVQNGTKYCSIVGFGCVGILIPLLPNFYSLWMGPAFMDLSEVTAVMLIGQVIIGQSHCANQVLVGLGDIRMMSLLNLLQQVPTVFLCWLYLQLDLESTLMGVCLLICFGRIFGFGLFINRAASVTAVSWNSLLRLSILRPLIACGITLAIVYSIFDFENLRSWPLLLSRVLVFEILFAGLVWIFCLELKEKILLLRTLKKLNPKHLL
jgi:membrane protein EpsK